MKTEEAMALERKWEGARIYFVEHAHEDEDDA
jgi:hypothetical protein